MLEVDGLEVRFGPVTAVDGVSFNVPDGPFGLGLVGESGSGTTTIGRAPAWLVKPSAGTIVMDGADVLAARRGALRAYRRQLQIVFQDPDSTLDPRMRVGPAIAEALRAHAAVPRGDVKGRVGELLAEVDLDADMA